MRIDSVSWMALRKPACCSVCWVGDVECGALKEHRNVVFKRGAVVFAVEHERIHKELLPASVARECSCEDVSLLFFSWKVAFHPEELAVAHFEFVVDRFQVLVELVLLLVQHFVFPDKFLVLVHFSLITSNNVLHFSL